MNDISMIGLGAMGTVLAKAQLKAGHDITVWNRSHQRMKPLVELGAKRAESVCEAVRSSSQIMVCVDNYAVTNKLLGETDVRRCFPGRTVIQMSTGTPGEARECEARIRECGADYLAVGWLPYPDGIGQKETRIIVSGPKEAFERSQPFLDCLGGETSYLGENVGKPAALDLAAFSVELAHYAGTAYANRLCEVEDVGLDLFASLYPEGSRERQVAEIVHARDYRLGSLHDGASIRVWAECVQRMQSQANDTQMNSELVDFLSSIFRRGGLRQRGSGCADQGVARLILGNEL
jgi:3-hydroxyisobutyrate dehydrogenase-like beta-hydroxyacid dehydrogenase